MKAFHFITQDLRAKDDLMLGISTPWRIGETRTYKPFCYDFGDGDTLWQRGYESSPTLWEAFLNCDGPLACLVDVSEPVHSEIDGHGERNFSLTRKLIALRDLSTDLRHFAVSCAEDAIYRASPDHAKDREVRNILQSVRLQFANGASSSRYENIFHAGMDLAFRHRGLRGCALCVAAAAGYPEAQDAALLVLEMAVDLTRIAELDERAERGFHRTSFNQKFASSFQ